MKQIWLWLVALVGAYSWGRRQCQAAALPQPAPRRSRGLQALALFAAILEAWARIAPRRPRHAPRRAGRRVAGRLGGEAVASPPRPMGLPSGAGAVMPAAGTPATSQAKPQKAAEEIPPRGLALVGLSPRALPPLR
jgi:hypothetical protein